MRRPPRDWFFAKRWAYQLGYWLATLLFNIFPLPQFSGFRESFRFAGESVDRGYSVLVFPEGEVNTSEDGRMAPFQSGIGLLVENLRIPIIPMRLDGVWQMKREHRRLAHIREITVRIGTPITLPPGTEAGECFWGACWGWGCVKPTLDPLGGLDRLNPPALAGRPGEAAEKARRIYCGTVGADFMHLPEPERRRWIAERLESPAGEVDQHKILERLIRADLFEQVLQARYLGTKRFSLEGVTALIPLLDSILDTAGEHGAVESVMAMR